MIKLLKKQRRLPHFIPVMGVLLVTTAFSPPSLAQTELASNALGGASALPFVVEKEEVVPGVNIPKAFFEETLQSPIVNSAPQEGAANVLGQSQYDEGPEDLILAVVTKQRRLSAGIFAVQNKGRYYLPVAGLSENFWVLL